MKSIKLEKEVIIYGTELEVTYNVFGKYMPATLEDPEEYPEIEIESVRVIGLDIEVLELLSDYMIDKILAEL